MAVMNSRTSNLFNAILTQRPEEIRSAFERRGSHFKRDVNKSVGPNRGSVLHLAVNRGFNNPNEEQNCLTIVDILLDNGAKMGAVDSFGNTALIHSAKLGKVKFVTRFLATANIHNKEGLNIMHIAAKHGRDDILDQTKIIKHGFESKYKAGFYLNLLNKPTTGEKMAFFSPAFNKTFKVFKWTPLHYSIAICHYQCTEWLVANGAAVTKCMVDFLKQNTRIVQPQNADACSRIIGFLKDNYSKKALTRKSSADSLTESGEFEIVATARDKQLGGKDSSHYVPKEVMTWLKDEKVNTPMLLHFLKQHQGSVVNFLEMCYDKQAEKMQTVKKRKDGISPEEMLKIADFIEPAKFLDFGIQLGFTPEQLDHIKHSYDNTKERNFYLIHYWISDKGLKKARERLCAVLTMIGKRNIVEMLQDDELSDTCKDDLKREKIGETLNLILDEYYNYYHLEDGTKLFDRIDTQLYVNENQRLADEDHYFQANGPESSVFNQEEALETKAKELYSEEQQAGFEETYKSPIHGMKVTVKSNFAKTC